MLRNRNRLRWGDWPTQLRSDLARLIALVDLGPTPVYLVGGLGLAVRSDTFYRNHGDIDLAVDTADLPEFSAFLHTCNYRLVRAVFGMSLSPWHRVDVTRPWSAADAGSDRCQDLAGVESAAKQRGQVSAGAGSQPQRVGENVALRVEDQQTGARVGRTGLMDLLPFSRGSDGLQLHGYGTTVPESDFFPALPVGNSRNLLLPNAAYKWHLPRRWRRQRHDLAVLARAASEPGRL